MMNITKLALKRPVTTCMFFTAILLLGLISTRLLPLEMFPGIDIPQVFIEVPYKGSTPAEVERDITQVLEESLATMSGIEELRSRSSQNGAEIELRMKWGENVSTKSLEAREKIDAVSHLLPKDLEQIFIRQFSTADMPIFNLRISSERELSGAFDLLDKQLKRPLERVEGISKVTLYGVEKKQIEIQIDANKLTATSLSLQAVHQRLRQENFIINAGDIKSASQVYQISPKGEFRNLDEIGEIVLAKGITLADIATINYTLPERLDGRHLDRNYAVGLDLFKESGANLVDVAARVMKVIEKAKQDRQFNGIKLFIMEDQAAGVKSSLQDLLTAGLIGAILSFAVLYLALRNFKMTLVVVSSVPISICMTLAAMYLLGYSLNILSMMGLLLAVGMLIDNAVVVTESVLQQEDNNSDRTVAEHQTNILQGVNKVALAVLAGTLTTAIVFLPNIFGAKVEITLFLEHVAIAICISLAASLLVAKTLLPLMLSRISIDKNRTQQLARSAFKKRYQTSLSWVLAHPKISVLLALVILLSTAIPLEFVKQDKNNGEGNNRLYINYMVEGRHSLEVTEAMVTKMEQYLYDNQVRFHIDSVYSYYAPDRGQSTLVLNEDESFDIKELKEQIREGFPTFSIAKPQFGWGNDSNGLRVTLTGRSTSELITLSEQVIPLLSDIEGLTDVRSEYSGAQQEVLITIDREMAARLDLPLRDIASTVSIALRGTQLRSFRHDPNGELRIALSFDKAWQLSLEKLKQLPIIRIDNRTYSLDNLAKITISPRFDTIRHYNRQTSLTIGANLHELTTEEAQEKIEAIMEAVKFPPGYDYSLTGGFQRQDEDQGVMITNMLLAIAMIYIVMAALFESLLLPTAIITSILFSITGVFWALLLTMTPMTIMAMIGILILMGIVVNNGIVLVDQINQMAPKLEQLSATITTVCLSRLRPVLMTVGTTVLGLIPLAVGDTQIGGGGPSYAPMAITIIGGLLFSTITSLYLVPLCYQWLYYMRHQSAIKLGRADQLSRRMLAFIK